MTRHAPTVLLVAIAAAVLALLLSMIPTLGVAGADPPDAGIAIPPPPPEAQVPQLPAQPPQPPVAAPDLDLWRTGLPLALILGALYAGLTVLGRQDPKRSLLWTFAAAVVLLVADAFRVDVTPNAMMILAAVGAIGTAAAPGMRPGPPRSGEGGAP